MEVQNREVQRLYQTTPLTRSRIQVKAACLPLDLAVAPSFKDKTRYTPYVSPGSQISHIATNKDNINR